ncbi:glycosyltransferase [Pseudomonas neustonica]|uniref:Glycosyltransferase n=1 Tax=Pseudomonas neustonica TaxID=2487346 RepID=A0ABX9XM95_9PSED|nr:MULTISPECIES: glycosyltransferase [Pseudomonas]MBA6420468.1 glycosyltransferase [Pseudomonas sp. 5Ae-yellow]ROZ87205.1 glycosyltransferase [Pseudomonas sp. SSM44]ROZ88178.1 glycosyltransferase [Pseudomonas neustonica]|tara:strand:+ start:760 stop:1884 length:1125 start_codon:yes stop_codon:yes gene_type:complete
MSVVGKARHVLQVCHGYDGPFLDCARQYAALFDGTDYQVTTVFLTGKADPQVAEQCHSAEVIFMGYGSADIRRLKLKAIRELRQIALNHNFSFCIAHRSKPTYIARLATDLAVIGVYHAFGDFQRPSRRLFARAFHKRLHLLAVSDAVREDIRRCLPGWPVERIQTLHNRINVAAVCSDQIERSEARAALNLAEDAWVVGNVGRLHPDKDQATLLKGFARALPDLPAEALLVILGTGRLEAKLKSLSETLGIADRVLFKGQVPHARRYFKAFDVFALTSDHEPFGMVLLEAMAAGNKLICSDCGGGPEVVGSTGHFFPLGDEAALSQVLLQCYSASDDQASRLVEQTRERLAALFSDVSAQQQFWALPMMAAYK